MRLTSEMLGGISSVKAYAWEKAFLSKLAKLRDMEHRSIFVSQSMKACTGALYFAGTTIVISFHTALTLCLLLHLVKNIVPAIASAATFTTYTYATENELDVDRVFVTIAILNMIRLFVGAYLGRLLEAGPECIIAMQRMRKFLLLGNVKPRLNTNRVVERHSQISQQGDKKVDLLAIAAADHELNLVVDVKDASFGRETVTIEKIDLSVAKGELVMIAGPVGW